MEEKGVYLAIQTPRQVRKKPMYKNGMYRETDKMSDLICENYPMVREYQQMPVDRELDPLFA